MSIHVVKVHDYLQNLENVSGRLVLADRLWPRGIKKELLPLDFWAKSLAPSNELRH